MDPPRGRTPEWPQAPALKACRHNLPRTDEVRTVGVAGANLKSPPGSWNSASGTETKPQPLPVAPELRRQPAIIKVATRWRPTTEGKSEKDASEGWGAGAREQPLPPKTPKFMPCTSERLCSGSERTQSLQRGPPGRATARPWLQKGRLELFYPEAAEGGGS